MTSSQSPTAGEEHPPVGIDLGTTYSVVAYLDTTGRPTTIANHAGDLLTPSALLVDDDEVIVGKEAAKSSVIAPESYAECFKRDMGGSNYHAKLRGLDVPPEVLSAFVLARLKEDAERRLGPITKVVITVPAFFDETRRRATQEAGRLADLEVLDIINEPTAAAVAYGYDRGFLNLAGPRAAGRMRVLVYDLGGGTFDVTILQIDGNRFEALATDGDVRLGGKDFDERLVNHLAEKFVAAHGVDPRSDLADAAQLWIDAQEAKHALSERGKTIAVCFHAGIRMRIEVTRTEFEDLIRDLVERTETTTSLVVRQAGLDWSQIDRVLLVGGSSRIPMVGQMLERITGKKPDCSQSPDEAVAHGAALYAGMLMSRGESSNRPTCELVNVNSHSLGVVGLHRKTRQMANAILIPKNTRLPCRALRVFKTAVADQRSVRVPVVEGESHRPEECIALGECVVRDLPPGLPQGTPIEVEYRYAANGRISVSARVPSVRQSAHVEIKRDQAEELGDLTTWRARLRGLVDTAAEGFSAGAGAANVDLDDRSNVLKRLDALYVKVGKAAMEQVLPEQLSHSQQAAMTAAAELTRARARLKKAELAKQAAQGSAETIRLEAKLSQAQTECEQAKVRADFAHLVLGRDCASAEFNPEGVQRQMREIRLLRQRLDR